MLRNIARALWRRLPLVVLYMLFMGLPCLLKLDMDGSFHFAKFNLITGLAAAFSLAAVLSLCAVRRWIRLVLGIILWYLCFQEFFVFLHFGTRFSSRILFFIGQTNPAEASGFFSQYIPTSATLWALLSSLLPLAVWWPLQRWWRSRRPALPPLLHRAAPAVLAVCFTGSAALCVLGAFTTVWFDKLSLPSVSQFVYAVKSVGNSRKCKPELEYAMQNCAAMRASDSVPAPAVVYVIGESLNKHHTPIYGYPLPTTPRLSRELERGNLIVFSNADTPFPATQEVMDVVYSLYQPGDTVPWQRQPFFPALFRKAGYKVSFHDNQATRLQASARWDSDFMWYFNSDIISRACFDYSNLTKENYDVPFMHRELPHIALDSATLCIVHLVGQHIPAEIRLEPGKKRRFSVRDYAARTDLNEEQKQAVADYDEAVLTTDSVLSLLFDRMRGKDAVLLFHSDHGEEVYDFRDNYGRTLEPVTPQIRRNIYEVPLVIYTTPEFRAAHPGLYAGLQEMSGRPFSLYGISRLLLRLGGIVVPGVR